MHTLEREILVKTNLTEAWEFLKNPKNLNSITPPDLHFQIISNIPAEMFNGLIVEYRVTIPYFGKSKWVAEIKHIREQLSFVDEQRIGPYKFWHHYHEIVQVGDRVKIIDRVNYELPYGPLGSFIHLLFVKNTLKRIFDYRKKNCMRFSLNQNHNRNLNLIRSCLPSFKYYQFWS